MAMTAGLLFLLALAPPALAASFDEQRAAMKNTMTTQPESAVLALVQAGLDEGKASVAIADVRTWLAQNRPANNMLLYYAGRAAELSGNAKDAVSLYQQYLESADLSSPEADEAAFAVYVLLIEGLQDETTAYDFSRNAGDRLLVCPRARQFDRWFLNAARQRKDVAAVVNRLLACEQAGLVDELFVAHFDHDFRWLVNVFDEGVTRAPKINKTLLDACKRLVKEMTVSEEMKLLLDWRVSVLYYHQAKLRGEDVDAPITEARNLLTVYPQYAAHVQTGWLGGMRDFHPSNVGELNAYWPHEVEAKCSVVIEAMARLNELQKIDFVQTWLPSYYQTHRQRFAPQLLDVKAIQSYLDANPDVMMLRSGPLVLNQDVNKISTEEAQALASRLSANSHPDVSRISAVASGGKDYDKVMEAFVTSEFWRIDSARRAEDYADSLWHYCGRPGGNEKRDEWKQKAKVAFEKRTAGDPGPESPVKERVSAFKSLWSDYRSSAPKQPNGYNRAERILSFSPELVPALLKTQDVDAQRLLRGVIHSGIYGQEAVWEELKYGRSVNVWTYSPSIHEIARRLANSSLDLLKERYPKTLVMHPLESVFRDAIEAGLASGKPESWKVIAWVNMQCPDANEAQQELARKLRLSSVWATLTFEAQFAMREWFGKSAMTPAEIAWVDAANAKLACKALLAVTEESDVSAVTAALKAAIAGASESPVYFQIVGMANLAKVPMAVFQDPSVFGLVLDILDGQRYRSMDEIQPFGDRIYTLLEKTQDPVTIQRMGSYVAHYAARGSRGEVYKRRLTPLIESLLDSHPESASVLAQNAVTIFERSRHIYGFEPPKMVPSLRALAAKAAMRLGLVTIPVPRDHPAYPIYRSQADWLMGNEDLAWIALAEHWDQLLPVHRKLSIEFLMWVLERTIFSRDDVKQEALIKALQAWAGEENTELSKERQVEIDLAYGDIAVQKGMLKEAHEIYKRTEQNKAYDGLLIKYEATLRKARVERLAKNFEAAINTLNELALERVPELWSPLHYAMAEVYYDMEEYDDANDQVTSILAREPTHADAKIMQGRLQLKRKKLMEATEVELGTISSKQTLVPGEKLKVTLTDPTLAISGAGTEIEVAVWATSGDRERFFLRQFGDQKTKFRGEVPTALGAPAADDGVLQVIGDDEVYYAYSERFRKKMNNMEEKRGGPITIASDALLMASGRRLLTEAEQRVADMETQMAALKGGAGAAMVKMAADADARMMQGETLGGTLTRTDIQNRLKPGNPIHVRVIDHDRSRTAEIDEVPVSISTSSGDAIGRVVLKETGTHTGWFEGQIQTAGAQAMAYAQNSEPGRNPNMVISPKTDYPAWRPVPVSGRSPEFTIDLNDNVQLGTMTITAKEPGSKLKTFVLQTGMNNRDVSTIAIYPKALMLLEKPWRPNVTILNDTDDHHRQNRRSVYELKEIQDHLERGWMSQKYAAGVAENVTGPSVAMTNSIPAKVAWKRENRNHNAHVIYRFQGYFYEPQEVTRRFKVRLGKWEPPKVHPSVADPAEYMLVVDGRIISEQLENPPKAGAPVALDGEINLRSGLHRFEIWATGWDCRIGFGRPVEVFANLGPDNLQLVACPDAFFDPESFPVGVLPDSNPPAAVTASDDGTSFSVQFAPDSKARVLRLLFVDQQGPVPVVNRITLQQPDGTTVLPVKQDYAELNKNDILEILTGDQVAVRYVDDRYVSKSKENHERFLGVSFSDASLAFEFFEMRKGKRGEDVPYYERQLRFAYGVPVMLTVKDPDMDISPELDTVKITVKVEGGVTKELAALENATEPGTFRAQFTPVSGAVTADNEISVPAGGRLVAIYRDMENTKPGIPTDRYASIDHAVFSKPTLRLSHSVVKPVDFESLVNPLQRVALNPGFEKRDGAGRGRKRDEQALGLAGAAVKKAPAVAGTILPQWQIDNSLHDADAPPEGGFDAVHGQSMYVELDAPHLALRMGSEAKVYVQTQKGRAAAPKAGEGNVNLPFDVTVPGTMKVQAPLAILGRTIQDWRGTPQIPIYIGGYNPSTASGLGRGQQANTGAFVCSVPLIAGILPENGVLDLTRQERYDLGIAEKHGLVVAPGDTVHVGVVYTDDGGTEQWVTGAANVITHPVFDVLDEDYRTDKPEAYVGENMYLRVVDLGADVSDDSDTLTVNMQAKSGAKLSVELLEVDTHSGIFKAALPLTYARKGGVPEDYDVLREGFPVVYGDLVGAVYVDAKKQKTPIKTINIRKGADGSITPFSKQYEDSAMAMQTQFALAEAYLEMAKNHRASGEEEEALREYDQARRLLAAVIDQFSEPETRAHAEYLLGNLTQEEADATEAGELQQNRYRAALARFMSVTGTYPDTEHASMAQFKIATVYEKLGEPDIAAQEYVKLAYKYPQSQFLALAMARLGTHFLRKASAYEKQATALLAVTDNKDSQFEGQAMQKMAVREYLNSGSIFSRMLDRFPSHELAGKSGLRAGQAYMRAESTRQALNIFLQIADNEAYDGPDIRAQSMYWAGMCYEKLREAMAAYAIYKRLTYDFPESKWAAFARGQLSQERMLSLETNLEIQRLEEEGK